VFTHRCERHLKGTEVTCLDARFCPCRWISIHSKLKAHMRAAQARSIEYLWKAIRNICVFYTPEACSNFLMWQDGDTNVHTKP